MAATKADHLHQQSHDRLEAILARLTGRAMARAEYAGAEVKALALASVRATREGEARRNGEKLPCIIGYPLAGETITAKLTEAPGNGAKIGGLKVTTENGWFAARPSGTEDVYKIYAESFLGRDHLSRIQDEARAIVHAALAE